MGFEDFWAVYPRKVGKIACLKIWARLQPDAVLVERMIQSVEDHKRCKDWRDGFICHPRTFLSQGRWMDELGHADFYHARL